MSSREGQEADYDDETVIVEMGSSLPAGVSAGTPASATVTIDDDDLRPYTVSLGSDTYAVDEGQSVTIEVSLNAAADRELDIPIEVSVGSAESGDYTVFDLPGGVVTFAIGESSKDFRVRALQEADYDDETVIVEIGSSLPAGVSAGTPARATVTIDDDDLRPYTVSLGSDAYSVDEGQTVEVEVSLNAAADRELDIPIDVSAGSAESGDYTVFDLSGGVVTFAVGESSKDFRVRALQEADYDDETVIVEIGSGLPARVSAGTPTRATVTIDDDDVPTIPFPTLSAPTVVVDSTDRTMIVATYSLPDPSFHYRVSLFRFDGTTYLPEPGAVYDPMSVTESEAKLSPSMSGTYRVGLQACRDAARGDCDSYVYSASSVRKLIAPTVLDVRPLHLRQAQLTWTRVPGVDNYVVEIQESGGTRASPHEKHVPSNAPTPSLIIELDAIIESSTEREGLADADAFEFRVRATEVAGLYLDSEPSEMVTITDNPIARANGDSRGAPLGEGQASLRWDRVPGVVEGRYTIRYWKLPVPSTWEGNTTWRPEKNTGDGGTSETHVDPRQTGELGSTLPWLEYTISDLELEAVYATQLNYETDDGWVYSGRDVYVWPSKDFPGDADRVATYPSFGHHALREYRYRICEETFFPEDAQRQADWVSVIEHAFEQWESAAYGFVVVTREHEACTDTSYSQDFYIAQASDDALSEVRMLGVSKANVLLFRELLLDSFKLCLLGGSACVTSRVDYSADPRRASNVLSGVDVTFNRNSFVDEPDHTPSDNDLPQTYPRLPNHVQFDICFPDVYMGAIDPDSGYSAYRNAVHEAGHALGLSDVTADWIYAVDILPFIDTTGTTYRVSHPTLPDAALNYDDQFPENYDESARKWIRYEGNCAPNPLDIMAIHSLYQTVHR